MNVAEMIEWLKAFPDQGATVQIVAHEAGRGYYEQGGNAMPKDFDPAKHVDYTDLRGNRHVKPRDPHFEQRTLLLGSYND